MSVVPEIALLGGSFNPPHVGHVMAAWWALATQGVEEVWLLPAYVHP
ncbi:MAG TPA: nicotinate-nicotinamide nucleotide adenylyltransferase, partial [Anaeromyxobacteraceae bacterium]|nr:nicotinate-nicotinamide nucleotide adenylyltransferase [Anaeromyxobacteraceae bacterium]